MRLELGVGLGMFWIYDGSGVGFVGALLVYECRIMQMFSLV